MGKQYSLRQILGILGVLAAIPMAILSWIVFPALSPDAASDPLGAGVTRIVLLIFGLIWLFVLSMIIVRQEEGDLRWATVKRRLRLNTPHDPKTGEARRRLWLWVIPFLIGTTFGSSLSGLRGQTLGVDLSFFCRASRLQHERGSIARDLHRLVGAWWFLACMWLTLIFNTILGEEFLFRGVLLPKMEGYLAGGAGWQTAGCLAYTIFTSPGTILANAISGIFLLAFPSWRFRSTWMAVIVHSAQSVFFAFLILGVVLGKA